jgi:hypothetical protein
VAEFVSVHGPVERVGDELILRIPLSVGGEQLAPLATKIARIDGDFLVVGIPRWLADKLQVDEGSVVDVDNANGKFNIRPRASSA